MDGAEETRPPRPDFKMSDEKSQQEPTMEEILASIRRIISENDEDGAKDKPSADEPPAADPAPAEPAAPEAAAAPAPEEEAKDSADEDEILELTDMVEEPESGPDDRADEVAATDPEPLPEPEVPPPAAAAPPPPPPPPPPPSPPMEGRDRLVSGATEAAATATLGALARELNRDAGTTGNIPIGPGNTLEDLVKDMIRPMLKDWLDQNLPHIVERLVRREIERMVRRAEDE